MGRGIEMILRRAQLVFIAATFGLILFGSQTSAQTVIGADKPALAAVKEGDFGTLRRELLRGENPNLSDSDGLTLMMHAVRNEFIDLIELLVENQANLLAIDRDGNTALHWAGIHGSYESAALLISLGATPDTPNNRGETALMVAVREDDRGIVELMLQANPDFSIRDYTGRSALDYARAVRDRRIEQLLRDAGAS